MSSCDIKITVVSDTIQWMGIPIAKIVQDRCSFSELEDFILHITTKNPYDAKFDYDSGYNDGHEDGYDAAKDDIETDYENRIDDLESTIKNLRLEIVGLRNQREEGYNAGYENARRAFDKGIF